MRLVRELVTGMNANDPQVWILTGDRSDPAIGDTLWSFVPGLVLPPAVRDTWTDTRDLQALTSEGGHRDSLNVRI